MRSISNANESKDATNSFQHTFVLKTYYEQDCFQKEVKAFTRLRNAKEEPSLIGFYGSFVHNSTYNIILEYADGGTLEDYFRTVSAPSNGWDILHFWKGILQIIEALCRIHEVVDSESTNSPIYQGFILLSRAHVNVVLILAGGTKT